MDQDIQAQPLAPVSVYPRSDVESAMFPPVMPKPVTRRKRASKCFVFLLVMVVVLSALALAFALTVFRVEAPEFRFMVASVNNLKYENNSNSTSTWVRGTLVGEVTLKNTNFGTFEHGNGAVNVSYRDKDFVGGKVIRQGRVRARETETVIASVNFMISGEGEGKNNTLREEVGRGIVRIRSNGKVVGKINVLGVLKKDKVGVMDCTISLELSSSRIKDLYCN